MATWDKVKTEVPHDPLREALRLSRLYEYNENHDDLGRFAPGDGGGSGGGHAASHSHEELKTMEDNLKLSGVKVRPEGSFGHMIMPHGKGLDPVSNRGISNHWEVAVDAGYLPVDALKSRISPQSVVNGMLKKGWVRTSGDASFEYWGGNSKAFDIVSDRVSKLNVSDNKTVYIDDVNNGVGYKFKYGDLKNNDFDLKKTLQQADKTEYQPADPYEFQQIEKRKK